MEIIIRNASPEDIFKVSQLYFDVYQGSYSDPMMKDFMMIQQYLEKKNNFWFVAESKSQIVGSFLAVYDDENLMAKAFGAVVRAEVRGHHVMERLMEWGFEYIQSHTNGVDIIYSTTRTVNEAAQSLTEKLGYKKLGIFPNAHKTNEYETHCLAAIIKPSALERRHSDYNLHHDLKNLYDIVREEIGFKGEVLEMVPEAPTKVLVSPPELEVIESPQFVSFRYDTLKINRELEFEFFPFYRPNLVLVSPDQQVELFCNISHIDGHCVVIGGKMPNNINFTELFLQVSKILRDYGARYVEVIVRADRPKILESIMKAKFIPCALFPAFQLIGEKRYDFFVFSRAFEVFDFHNVRLKGTNMRFLEEYFKIWKKTSLMPKLLDL